MNLFGLNSLTTRALLCTAIAATSQITFAADSLKEALQESKATGNFRMRYEELDRATDVDLLTLKSLVGVKTGTYKNFSAVVEVEDVRAIGGIDGPLAYEPETTEIDQAFIQYKTDKVTAKLGRQVITLDGHRFIGHVGFRQDRQTFDGARFQLSPMKGLNADISYLYQRNRIFAEAADADSSDILVNLSYKTSIGKLVGYSYLLDDDRTGAESDTFGLSLTGSTKVSDKGDTSFLYHAEYATQDIDSANADADYMFAEAGIKAAGITAKLGYEVLGSDNGQASFTTPLATLHKFNGWNDIFLGGTFNPTAMPNGLEDTYVSLAGKISGVGLKAVYHEFSADEGGADYGSEWGFQAAKGFKNGLSLGLKYSSYDSDGFAVDTDRIWIWSGYKF